MPAESKKLDTKCLEPFGGEIWGLSFAVAHSEYVARFHCPFQIHITCIGISIYINVCVFVLQMHRIFCIPPLYYTTAIFCMYFAEN